MEEGWGEMRQAAAAAAAAKSQDKVRLWLPKTSTSALHSQQLQPKAAGKGEHAEVGEGGAAFAYKCNHFVVQTSKTKSEIGKTKAKREKTKQKEAKSKREREREAKRRRNEGRRGQCGRAGLSGHD